MKKADAIKHFGGPTKLAALLDVTRQAIYMWPETVPDLYQYKLHYLSNGALEMSVPPPCLASKMREGRGGLRRPGPQKLGWQFLQVRVGPWRAR
jgi:hypothetical protein